jgi:AAT family amino acid transporter
MEVTTQSQHPGSQGADGANLVENEQGLARQLNSRQLAMIAIGGAIGTGLFLGSSLAVRVAGPAVIVTYLMGAVIALLLTGALSEMAVAHPTAGSFGVYAELYVSKWAGFVVRYTYWAAQAIAIGGEATAVAIYCRWWFPRTPAWMWVVIAAAALIYINARSVGSFGEFEYWFSMVKVIAIVFFIVFGILTLSGYGKSPTSGIENLTSHGGFFPFGIRGAWLALVFVIFGFIGTETVAVAAGEAENPEQALPKAMRSMVARLAIFYIASIIILVAVIPWNQIQPGSDITASPFVRVFAWTGVPAAAHIVNFVVLTAALSSMNCNIYLATRMMFSLARGGYAPNAFGRVARNGAPINALLISAVGLGIAAFLAYRYQSTAFVYMFGVALFGGVFVWLMIFVTFFFFRKKWRPTEAGRALPIRMRGHPVTTAIGAAAMTAILISSWWVDGMKVTLKSGIPWLIFLTVVYYAWGRKQFRINSASVRK